MRARTELGAPGGVARGPIRCPSTSNSTRLSTTACSTRRWRPRPQEGVHGKAITPFLLDRLNRETGGDSLRANIALVTHNAALAGEIAVAAAAA